jgi:hypothetical protein
MNSEKMMDKGTMEGYLLTAFQDRMRTFDVFAFLCQCDLDEELRRRKQLDSQCFRINGERSG